MKRKHKAASQSIDELGKGLAALEKFMPNQPRSSNDPKSWNICQEVSDLKAQIAHGNALLQELVTLGQRQTEELSHLISGACIT